MGDFGAVARLKMDDDDDDTPHTKYFEKRDVVNMQNNLLTCFAAPCTEKTP